MTMLGEPCRRCGLENCDADCSAAGSNAAPLTGARAFPLTDSGNAELFTHLYRDELRYDHRRSRWLCWTGHRWQPDVDGEVDRRAKQAARVRLAAATRNGELDKDAVRWALTSENRGRLDATVRLARAERPLADDGSRWDTDPFLLGVPNGVVDLRTGMLRDGHRSDRITMCAGVPFVPEAPAPRWQRFIEDISDGDGLLVDFLQRAVGYSLTGDTNEQVAFMPHGSGSNGKGVLARLLLHVVGDYGHTMGFSALELQQRTSIPNDLAALVGKRFVISSETNEGTRLNEARFKMLTGCDSISARFLNAEFFEFRPVAKFWLSVNHKPVVRDQGHGFWRRVRVVPFTRTFPVDSTFEATLLEDAPGILAWAVEGCRRWQEEGLNAPDSVRHETDGYREESDPLGDFIAEACEIAPAATVRAADVFEHYRMWATTHGLTDRERLTATAFGRKLKERFRRDKDCAGHFYKGIARASIGGV